jgi:hypothetical protein
MSQRRYDDAEVAAIFERASEAQARGLAPAPSREGMTLAELQEIGREVGLSPDAIALAARRLEHGGSRVSRRILGLPLGVEHTVQLDRRLGDEEWEHLVVVLRETFDARGKVAASGSLRQWTNGSLQALLEPTPEGDRLRLRTVKSSAPGMLLAGAGMTATSAVLALLMGTQEATTLAGTLAAVLPTGVAGLGLLLSSVVQLPRWARTRREQMESIAARLQAGDEG